MIRGPRRRWRNRKPRRVDAPLVVHTLPGAHGTVRWGGEWRCACGAVSPQPRAGYLMFARFCRAHWRCRPPVPLNF